jgi:hypothetical protein
MPDHEPTPQDQILEWMKGKAKETYAPTPAGQSVSWLGKQYDRLMSSLPSWLSGPPPIDVRGAVPPGQVPPSLRSLQRAGAKPES